jgi:hypothetical protein
MEDWAGPRPWRAAVGSFTWRLGVVVGLTLAAACSGGGSGTGDGSGMFPVVAEPAPRTLAQMFAPGDVIGVLELEAPSVSPFVLQGTLPLPAQSFVEPSTSVPFRVRQPDGALVDAQVQTVTRWARAADGADVVEIQARVARPAGAAPGDRLRYEIVWSPHPRGQTTAGPDVAALFTTPNAVVLRTRDVFGHVYEADLLADTRTNSDSHRWLKRGRVASQSATHEVLKPIAPVAGETGTLPHMMGAHAYVTTWSDENFVSLDLRVHTGFSGRDPATSDDDPQQSIYFEELELVVPAGWVALEAFDTPYSPPGSNVGGSFAKAIVRNLNDGDLHVMPRLSQFERRLVLARVGSEARALALLGREGLGFCRDVSDGAGRRLCSWWNPDTGRWYPQRQPLPSLGIDNEDMLAADLSGQWQARRTQLQTGAAGSWPAETPNLGWAHPWGVAHGGMVSGSEIYLCDGADVAQAAARDGIRLTEIVHRMYTERQPNILFNANGQHARASEWVVTTPQGTFLPILWYTAPLLWLSDPYGYGQAPSFQVAAVAAAGRQPWYEGQLLSFMPIDWQHLIRYTRSAKTLLWLANDTLAKEDLRAQAEGYFFGYTTLPQDQWGAIISSGMLAMINYAEAFPGVGLDYGRGQSWGLDVVLCAYSTADDAWRAEARPWFQALIDMLERGQMDCSGIIQSAPFNHLFNGQYRCRQSVEAAIIENSLVALRETVLDEEDPANEARVNEVLRRTLYAMISPYVWSDVHNGPWAMMATGPVDMSLPPYCSGIPADGNYGFADHYQTWSSLAYGYELVRDPLFLQRASDMLGGQDLVAALTSDPLSNWQNRAALIRLAQTLAEPAD